MQNPAGRRINDHYNTDNKKKMLHRKIRTWLSTFCASMFSSFRIVLRAFAAYSDIRADEDGPLEPAGFMFEPCCLMMVGYFRTPSGGLGWMRVRWCWWSCGEKAVDWVCHITSLGGAAVATPNHRHEESASLQWSIVFWKRTNRFTCGRSLAGCEQRGPANVALQANRDPNSKWFTECGAPF